MRSDSSDSNINLSNIRGARTKEINKNNHDDDYDSDFTFKKNNQNNLNNNLKSNSLQKTFTKEIRSKSSSSSRSRKRSNSSEKRNRSMSPVSKKKSSPESNYKKKQSYSSRSRSSRSSRSSRKTRSRTRSSDRSRETYQVQSYKNTNNKANNTSSNFKKPTNGFNYSNGLPKKNKIQSNSANNSIVNGNRKKYSGTASNLSKNSSESFPANLNKHRQVSRKNNLNNKNAIPKSQANEALNQTVMRLMSAQRLKNNDLQNRIAELNIEIEKLKDENKLLKRVHHREEIAIKKFESHDNDVSRLVKNHADETHALKETIKNIKNENRRLNSTLIDKDEEIRSLKKKKDDLKKILNDKKLFDSLELSKKLDQAEASLAHYKTKSDTLERKLEMIEKNHKHEIGVEIAHHKETQKNYNKLNEEYKELKTKLEEKERALDMANIYSRNIKENNTGRDSSHPPAWKASTQSLNNSGVNETPREKRKQYDKNNNIAKTRNPKVAETKLDSPKKISENTEREEAEKKQMEIEMQIRQQDADLKKKDAIERSKRLQKEKEEEERLKKLKEDELKAQAAIELERRRNHELEERKRKEKEALEEEERKKRWISENTIKQEDDKMTKEISKKDELLAKLSLLDNTDKKNNNSINHISDNNETLKTSKKSESVSTLPPKPSFKNEPLFNSNEYKFSQTIENLHDGKPAVSSKDSNKNELLNKLFGNNSNTSSNTINDTFNFSQTKSNQSQSKLDKVDDIFSPKASVNNKPAQQTSSKVNLLPWEIDDLNFNVSSNQKATAVANFGSTNNNKTNNNNSSLFNDNNNIDSFFSMNSKNRNEIIKKPNDKLDRPKMENKLIFSSNHHKTNNAFVEDIEELTL